MADDEERTRDLLSGFDRPARTPRTAAVRRHDFAGGHVVDPRRNEPTALVTRARQSGWLPWIAVAFLGSTMFGIALWLALTPTPRATPPPATTEPAPSVRAPVDVASAPPPSPPPPPPAAPASSTAAKPRAAAPRPTPSADPPRKDFIHEL